MTRSIGACNTLIRSSDGSFKAYNTDWVGAIYAIETSLAQAHLDDNSSPLQGKRIVIIGAGGTARALAFGAAHKYVHSSRGIFKFCWKRTVPV